VHRGEVFKFAPGRREIRQQILVSALRRPWEHGPVCVVCGRGRGVAAIDGRAAAPRRRVLPNNRPPQPAAVAQAIGHKPSCCSSTVGSSIDYLQPRLGISIEDGKNKSTDVFFEAKATTALAWEVNLSNQRNPIHDEPALELPGEPSNARKRVALMYRSVILGAALWIVIRNSLSISALDRRLVELTLRELTDALLVIAFAIGVSGWLILRLLHPPERRSRSRAWCEGWIYLGNMILVLFVGIPTLLILVPNRRWPFLATSASDSLTWLLGLFL